MDGPIDIGECEGSIQSFTPTYPHGRLGEGSAPIASQSISYKIYVGE
jgi:hypothetical protein